MTLFFDIETNGLQATKVHCLVTANSEGDIRRYRAHDGSLEEGLRLLSNEDEVVGHNIIGYDIPTLARLHKLFISGNAVDTYVLSGLLHADIAKRDFRSKTFPKKLAGRHSLKAWGYRLGVLKGAYCEQEDAWEKWTPEMEDYCEQDVRITRMLYMKLQAEWVPQQAVDLEHDFYRLMTLQERHGFWFDRPAAERLYADLLTKRFALQEQLQKDFKPKLVQLKTKVKEVPFNPASRQQIAERLIEMGWQPKEFTATGIPKVTDDTLEDLESLSPAAKTLADYLLISKRVAQLAEGKNAWLKLVGDDQRMHGRVISVGGTVSHRCAHASPNMAQVPAVRAPYGHECRSLFAAEPGKVLVGCDVSGLELRVLAHYLARLDGGAYVKAILEGDIHVHNQLAAGLETRDQAKTFIYAFIYGAGNEKLGAIASGDALLGGRLRSKFLKALPALKAVQGGVKTATKIRGWLKGIDGRRLYPRSQHSALNLLIQSTGAIIVKRATCIFIEKMLNERPPLTYGRDFALVAHVHDEWQTECAPQHADLIKRVAVEAIEEAGRFYNLRCPLTGEAKSGATWSDTH